MSQETGNNPNTIPPLIFAQNATEEITIKEITIKKITVEEIRLEEIKTEDPKEAVVLNRKVKQAVLNHTEENTMTAELVEKGFVIRKELTRSTAEELGEGTEASLGKPSQPKTAKIINTSPLPKRIKEELIDHCAGSDPSNFKVVDSQNIGSGIREKLAQLRGSLKKKRTPRGDS